MSAHPHTASLSVLLIGRQSAPLATRLQSAAGPLLLAHIARLPAEGIRRFEETPPDALIIVDESAGARARALIQAIQARPLGRLIPILLISARPASSTASPHEIAAELLIDAWLPHETPTSELLATLADLFDMEPDALTHQPLEPEPAAPPASHVHASSSSPSTDEDRLLEAMRDDLTRGLDDPHLDLRPPTSAIERVHRDSLFPARRANARAGEVTEEIVRKKLREVRHEDYFTILEVRRGAETPVIRDAHSRLAARYDAARLDFELVHRCYQELAEICDALEDAWAVLGDNELRRAYLLAHSDRTISTPS